MGREATRREVGYQEAALETFELERTLGASEDAAIVKAVEAAVSTYRRSFIVGVRDDLLYKAEELDADEDNDLNEDGPAALIWYAIGIDETLPPEQRKGWN